MTALTELLDLYGGDWEKVAKETGVPSAVLKEKLILDEAKGDPEFFATSLLKIRNKAGQLVPLIPNRGQMKIQAAIDRQRKAGRPVRIKLLKARQFGGTTWVKARDFHSVMFEKHRQSLTVCHDLDSAKNIRAMFERFIENYPFDAGKPSFGKVGGSDKWWKFHDRDYDYLIDTAEELATGRSFTIHRLHVSEAAFFRNARELMVGLLQTVPNAPETEIVIESTANGIGDWFYDFINADNDYELVFVGWHEIEEYTRPFAGETDRTVFESSLEAQERMLLDSGITLEQLNWRRYTIENNLQGDEKKFQQEYPRTPEEAFVASGRPFFPLGVVRKNLAQAVKAEPKRGFLEWDTVGESVKFSESPDGWWTVLKKPEEGYEFRYVTGTDTAEGKADDKDGKDPDYSSCTVLDRVDTTEAARFWARVDTDVFSVEVRKASVFYKSACDCIERNGPGRAVIDALKNVLPNLYRREVIATTEEKETLEYGFQTNSQSRDLLLSEFRKLVREGTYKSMDAGLWEECLAFVYDSKGVPRSQRGKHDDRVFSAALAVEATHQANELTPIVRPDTPRSTDRTDEYWGEPETEDMRATF